MPATYEPIATTTLGSSTKTITFSSIPSTYTDLRIVTVGTMTAGFDAEFRLNNSASGNSSGTFLRGNGSTASSGTSISSSSPYYLNAGGYSATIPFLAEIDVFSYTGSTFKSFLTRLSGDQNGSGWVKYGVGLYQSTAAVTSVELIAFSSAVWFAGTTATLYGIKAA